MKSPHCFAVTRLADNRLNGLMRAIAELIDGETDARVLSDLRISLSTLSSGAHYKAHQLSKGKFR